MKQPRTQFASPQRQSIASVRKAYQRIKHLPYIIDLYDSLPHVVFILNKDRQIVYSNHKLMVMAGISNEEEYLGSRPGELFHCLHAATGPSGCGTAAACQVCGAVLAVLESQNTDMQIESELRLTSTVNDHATAYDFKVIAAPAPFEKEEMTTVHLLDISDVKRRRALEKIFFHDILNTAGALLNLTELECMGKQHEAESYAGMIHSVSKQLIDELKTQRELMRAENDELTADFISVRSTDILEQSVKQLREYTQLHQLHIKMATDSEEVIHETDPVLLRRVICNLVKNALEASDKGQTVRLGCCQTTRGVIYWVKNQKTIPEKVQMQIFQRYFSTKGQGRGLGTYSVRLLTEKFLKGQVSFESTKENGTCFMVTYPKSPLDI